MSEYDDLFGLRPDGRPGYYNRDGSPAIGQAAVLAAFASDREVARTELDGVLVSTVFLVIDHSYPFTTGPRVPMIFETMIFVGGIPTPVWPIVDDPRPKLDVSGPLDDLDGWCRRYATEAAALAGHDQACALVRDRLDEMENR